MSSILNPIGGLLCTEVKLSQVQRREENLTVALHYSLGSRDKNFNLTLKIGPTWRVAGGTQTVTGSDGGHSDNNCSHWKAPIGSFL